MKKPVNLCKPNPCMHDGICILSPGSFQCRCKGYEGPHCEQSEGTSVFLLLPSNLIRFSSSTSRDFKTKNMTLPFSWKILTKIICCLIVGWFSNINLIICSCHILLFMFYFSGSSNTPSRGDVPRPSGLRKKSRQRKSHQELLRHYKLHRRRHAA